MIPKRIAVLVLTALALLPLQFSHAGGWASVEIVERPEIIESGQPMTFQLARSSSIQKNQGDP